MARTPLFAWMGRMVRRTLQAEPALQSAVTRPVTRRDFLKGMAGVAGAAALGGLSPTGLLSAARAQTSLHAKSLDSPVAIVGGGLGGLVTAYRLTRQGIPCALYEAGRRLGGRVYTQRNFNPEGMFVELGGELVDTGHADLIALCDELHIPLERFATGEPGIEPAIFFSGGAVHTEADVLAAFQPLAKALAEDIRRCFPDGEVQIPTYRQPFQAAWLDRISLEDYLNAKRDVAPWLIRLIKTAYAGEYGLEPQEQSALNLLILIRVDTGDGFAMFGESDEAMRIQGGNSRLVQALADALAPHVSVCQNHRLQRLADDGHQLHLTFKTGSGFRRVVTQRVVLALPFSVLRHVHGLDALGLSDVKKKSIAEWGYGTNSKQMIGFRTRFWREHNPGVPANTGELFTDLPSQCYWETSRLQAGTSGILTNFLGGAAGRDATPHQWQIALQDLDSIYGGAGSPTAGEAEASMSYQPLASRHADDCRAFFNWSRNPLARGSYTCPTPGQYTTLMGSAQEPELGGRLFFAGEHCSVDWAGFMNGAVESGNAAARLVAETLSLVPVRLPLA